MFGPRALNIDASSDLLSQRILRDSFLSNCIQDFSAQLTILSLYEYMNSVFLLYIEFFFKGSLLTTLGHL